MKTLITSPQRCGSTWLSNMTAFVFGSMKACFLYQDEEPKLWFDKKNPKAISNLVDLINSSDKAVFKSHDVSPVNWDEILKNIPELKITKITRDFKDVVISRYFYERYHIVRNDETNEKTKLRREETNKRIKSAVNNEQDDIKAINKLCYTDLFEKWLYNWKIFNLPDTNERVFKTRYEKLFEREEIERYMKFLDAPQHIAGHIQKIHDYKMYYFEESKFNLSKKEERFCRNGKIGDHKNYMTEETIKYVNKRCSTPLKENFYS
jgi:hypothetical protein